MKENKSPFDISTYVACRWANLIEDHFVWRKLCPNFVTEIQEKKNQMSWEVFAFWWWVVLVLFN